jgi:RNA polymerase sigma-70 factor (ECF subfamily)
MIDHQTRPRTGNSRKEQFPAFDRIDRPASPCVAKAAGDLRLERDPWLETVRPHLGAIHALASRILRSDDLAWDAVQETLTTLWRQERAPVALRGWLRRTVVHRSLHLRRTLERRRRNEDDVGALLAPGGVEDPSRALEASEMRDAIRRALMSLGRPQRVTFLLREMDGLDYQSIARLLGVSIGTVRSRLNRARGQLRADLRRAVGNSRAGGGTFTGGEVPLRDDPHGDRR